MDGLALERRRRRNEFLQKREADRQRRILEEQRTAVPAQADAAAQLPQENKERRHERSSKLFARDSEGSKPEGLVRYLCGSEITKTSPASSVSMSQSPETWSAKRLTDRPPKSTTVISKTKKNIFSTDESRPKKRGRLLQPDSGSSDDEDLFGFGSKRGERQTQSSDEPLRKAENVIPGSRKTKWIWEDLDSSSDSGVEESKQLLSAKKSITKSPPPRRNTAGVIPSTAKQSDEVPELSLNARVEVSSGEVKPFAPIAEPAGSPSVAQIARGLGDNFQLQKTNVNYPSAISKVKTIRNPLLEEKAQREQASCVAIPTPTARSSSLWEDSDGSKDDDDQPVYATTPSKQNDTLINEAEDVEQLRSTLYPSFDRPEFGSEGEPVPLILNEYYEVPASINRYLAEYQQEGTKFMFSKAVAIKRGCILADGTSF